MPAPARPAGADRPFRPWAALAVLCIGNFLILLDSSIVNTALPEIQRDLDAGIAEALWVLNGYLLAFAALLIVFGRLGDLRGPRTVFVAGLAAFVAASLLCAVSQSPGQLVAARVAQGVGAAALLPQALVLIAAIFPPQRRGAAFGIFTAVAGIAAVSGPTLGGLLITELGWQSIFLINLPVGLLGIVLTLRFVPDLRPGQRHRFDLLGVLLATVGLLAVTYGLVEGQRHHWGAALGPVSIPVIIGAGVVLLVLFVLWERRQPEPLIPLRLFRDRSFTVATMLSVITSFALFGVLLVYVLQTQTVLGMSPLESGLVALPWTVTLSAVAPVAGRLTDRVGGRVLLLAGLACNALGVLTFGLVSSTGSNAGTLLLPLVLVGLGIGMTIAPTTTEAMRGIPPLDAGAASGVLNTARQVGAVIGAAVVGAVLQNRLVHALHQEAAERVAQLPPAGRGPFLAGFDTASAEGLQLGAGQSGAPPPTGLPADLAGQVARLTHDTFGAGFVSAVRPTLAVVAALLLAGAVLAAFLPGRHRLRLVDAATAGAPPSAESPGTDPGTRAA